MTISRRSVLALPLVAGRMDLKATLRWLDDIATQAANQAVPEA